MGESGKMDGEKLGAEMTRLQAQSQLRSVPGPCGPCGLPAMTVSTLPSTRLFIQATVPECSTCVPSTGLRAKG